MIPAYPEIGSCRVDYVPFFLGTELSDRLSNGMPFPCCVAYCLWSHFYFIILYSQLSIPQRSEHFQQVVRERKFCIWHTHTTIKKYFIGSYVWCSSVILDDRLCYIVLRRFAFLIYWSFLFSCVPSTRDTKVPPIVVDIYMITRTEIAQTTDRGTFEIPFT